MNWEQIEGQWRQAKGKLRQKWGKLTDDDLDVIDGRREDLSGRIQKAYGVTKDEADRQISQFADTIGDDRSMRTNN
jgi:uncharacterized protein YjbJ (UPF0337 family)